MPGSPLPAPAQQRSHYGARMSPPALAFPGGHVEDPDMAILDDGETRRHRDAGALHRHGAHLEGLRGEAREVRAAMADGGAAQVPDHVEPLFQAWRVHVRPGKPRWRDGRRNRYQIRTDSRLRHPLESHRTVGELLALLASTP